MKVVFYLKGSVQLTWRVPVPEQFNFQLMVKMVRADGQFLAEGVYVQASEIAAILLEHENEEMIDDDAPNVGVIHQNKVRRLVS